MKINELMAHLEKFDPELDVVIDHDWDVHPAGNVEEYIKGKSVVISWPSGY